MAKSFFTVKPGLATMWFPAAMLFLLILAIPGVILLALNLFGLENDVNTWLQEHWSLSYHIPIPWWASLLLVLAPFFIILLYFLKLKRKPLQVPSTFLWKKSIEDLHVNALFQWLRDNVLLLIQLLILLIVIYSVLGFQIHGRTGSGHYYILMVDNSASMAVADVSPSRLEAAKRGAIDEIDGHSDGDVGMVIEFNSRAKILQPYTVDRKLLRAAVQGIEQTQRSTNIVEALSLADSLANPRKSGDNIAVAPSNPLPGQARDFVPAMGIAADVHLFSDGRFPDVQQFDAGLLSMNYHRIGKPGPDVDNVGIVAINATRDESNSGKVQVFIRVANYRQQEVEGKVRLEVRLKDQPDFKLYEKATSPATIPARQVTNGDPAKNEGASDQPGEGIVTFELTEVDESSSLTLHAILVGIKDAFPLDDEAWLVLGMVRKARIAIVTPGNDILSDFFDQNGDSVEKVATIVYLKPDDLKNEAKYLKPAHVGEFDLVIFDRCAPETEEDLPLANTFFIDSVPPPLKRADMPPLDDPIIRNPASKHPLMRNLTALDEIAIFEAFRFPLDDKRVSVRRPPLLETGKDTGVLLVLARNSFTDLVMTFPLINDKGKWTTTWNLKLSFPVFLRNVLYTLGNVSDTAAEETIQPGDLKLIRPDVVLPNMKVDVFDPSGGVPTKLDRSAQGDFAYKETERVGVYRAKWDGGERSFAVNLLDADESNLQPRDEISLGGVKVTSETRGQVRDTWKWGAAAALALLLLEWALYYRRIFT
jgi:hypothetical protein